MRTFADRHKTFFIILGIILIVAIALIVKNKNLIFPSSDMATSGSGTPTPTIKVDYSNLAQVLSSSGLVRDLPEGATLSLRFYNFDTGERQWEKSYIITKGNVQEGEAENPDITFIIHSKYLKEMTNKNFCSVISQARANGDLGMETGMSKTRLAWKFRSLLKYKDCLGF